MVPLIIPGRTINQTPIISGQLDLSIPPDTTESTPAYSGETYTALAISMALLSIVNHLQGQSDKSDEEGATPTAGLPITPEDFMKSAHIHKKTTLIRRTGKQRFDGITIALNKNVYPIVKIYSYRDLGSPREKYTLEVQITTGNGTDNHFYKFTLDVPEEMTYLFKLIKQHRWFARRDDDDDEDDPDLYQTKPKSSSSGWSWLCCGRW